MYIKRFQIEDRPFRVVSNLKIQVYYQVVLSNITHFYQVAAKSKLQIWAEEKLGSSIVDWKPPSVH